MNWIQFLFTILCSSGILGIFVYYWQKRVDQKFNKELENFKCKQNEKIERLSKQLEKHNYVSKVRFDTEFEVYRTVFDAIYIMVLTNNSLFSRVQIMPEDKNIHQEFFREKYNDAAEKYENAIRIIESNAPFVTEELYNDFMLIATKCRLQIQLYWDLHFSQMFIEYNENRGNAFKEGHERQDSIIEDRNNLIIKVRNYLNSLDVK